MRLTRRLVAGTYQGQWYHGMRHGYGVRASAPFGLASHYKPSKQVRASLTSLRSADDGGAVAPTPEPTDRRDRRVGDSRGGFVLKARSDNPPARRKSLTEKSLKKGILSVNDLSRTYIYISIPLDVFPRFSHHVSRVPGVEDTKAEEHGRFGEAWNRGQHQEQRQLRFVDVH